MKKYASVLELGRRASGDVISTNVVLETLGNHVSKASNLCMEKLA